MFGYRLLLKKMPSDHSKGIFISWLEKKATSLTVDTLIINKLQDYFIRL